MTKKLLLSVLLIIGIALMSFSVLAVKGVNITDSEITLSGTSGDKTGYVHIKNIGDEKINVTFESSILVDSAGHSLPVSGLNTLKDINPGSTGTTSFTVDLDDYAGNYTGVITASVQDSSESDSVMAYVEINDNGLGLSVTPSIADSTEADTVITQTVHVQNMANKDISGNIIKSGYDSLSFSLDKEGSYTFPALQSTDITATVVVPAAADAKAYTGKVNITAETSYTSTLQTIVQPTFKASVPQVTITMDPGSSGSANAVISNTGNVDLTGLSITNVPVLIDNDGDAINLTVYPNSSINIPAGTSKTSSITARASQKIDSGRYEGTLRLSGSGISQDFNVVVEVRDILQITDIDLSDDEFAPGDTIEVDVEVENIAEDIDLEDVEIEVYFLDGSSRLEDDDGDDLEAESEKFDLDAGDSETISFEFEMPYGVDDGDTFTLHVEARAQNADDSSEDYEVVDESLTVTAEKDDHKLEFFDVRLDSDELSCSRSTYLRVGVRNIGDSNEDDVELAVTNAELGVSKHVIFDLDNDPDDDEFEEERSFLLNLQGAPTGTYDLNLVVYYDDDDEDEQTTIPVTISSCSGSSTPSYSDDDEDDYTPPSTPTDEDESVEFTYSGGSSGTSAVTAATAATPRITSTSKKSSWTDSVAFLVLVGLANILLIIVIIVAVVMLVKK
ncbi:hypothetical protein GF345_02910 [Candidatus Woesearchaeota archaeon]|nr:hypothetical protein [Candidatus Woesearchaeota archaeon]